MQSLRGHQFEQIRCKVLSQLWVLLHKKHFSLSQINKGSQRLSLPCTSVARHREWSRYRYNTTSSVICNDRTRYRSNACRQFHTRSMCLCSTNGDDIDRSPSFEVSGDQLKNENETKTEEIEGEGENIAQDITITTDTEKTHPDQILTEQLDTSDENNGKTEQSLVSNNRQEHTRPTRVKIADKIKHDNKSFTATELSNKFLDATDFPLTEDITNLLKSIEIPYDEGFTGYHMVCPKFGKLAMKQRKKEQRLYVNSKSGYFVCNACKISGYWSYLKENIQCQKAKKRSKSRVCFNDVAGVTHEVEEIPAAVRMQMDDAEPFSNVSLEQFDNILAIFDWHGLTRNTFIDFGVRYKIDGNRYSVLFPIQSMRNGVITAVRVYTGLVSEEDDVKVTVKTYPRNREPNDLFGWQHQPTQKTLVITSSEVNAMAISQATGTTALALKSTTQLPLEILAPLEEFTKIILWIGTDIIAWECTNTFAKKLNDRRCFIFRLNTVLKMPLQMLQDEEDVKELMQEARIISHKDIVKFSNLRGDVFSELAHLGQVAGIQWQKYTPLNRLMKGHRRGELTVLTGPTGSGKTTFVSDYSLDLCMQGVNTLWGSFEINNVKLAKMMLRQFSGKDLTRHLEDFDQVADDFSRLPMYYMTYFGQENINKVLEVMTHAVYVHDISHVVIDNLQFMMGMDYNEGNRFVKQDHIVATFRRFATEKNCHVTLITHPRKVDDNDMLSTASIFGSAKLTQESDNVLLIQDIILNKSLGRVKLLQIAKNRFDGELGILMMNFNKESLGFALKDRKKKRSPQNKEHDQLSADHNPEEEL